VKTISPPYRLLPDRPRGWGTPRRDEGHYCALDIIVLPSGSNRGSDTTFGLPCTWSTGSGISLDLVSVESFAVDAFSSSLKIPNLSQMIPRIHRVVSVGN
jgi:hypothetical protein